MKCVVVDFFPAARFTPMFAGVSPVAKKNKSPEYVSVKIESEVYRLVRTIASYHGKKIGVMLSEIAGPEARRRFLAMQKGEPPADAAREEADD
jgi:hypothetical protein